MEIADITIVDANQVFSSEFLGGNNSKALFFSVFGLSTFNICVSGSILILLIFLHKRKIGVPTEVYLKFDIRLTLTDCIPYYNMQIIKTGCT